MTDAKRPNIQGEGDYDAARRYDEAAKRFVEEGKVGPAAERAKTDDPAVQADLERAEEAGRSRAKEEDRLLRRGSGGPAEGGPSAGGTERGEDRFRRHGREGGGEPEGQGGR